MVPVPALVGTHEIAAMLGVSRQRVLQLAATDGFPAPVARLKAGNIWVKADIEEWAETRRRPSR
ncbi:helix-turn-helix transcriptional regulator [Nocardioides pakistanensis]